MYITKPNAEKPGNIKNMRITTSQCVYTISTKETNPCNATLFTEKKIDYVYLDVDSFFLSLFFCIVVVFVFFTFSSL